MLSPKEEDSCEKFEPVSAPASTSTISARPYPLAPPSGAIMPSIAACGSVVGWPDASRAQPSGIGPPREAALSTFTRAVALVAMSRMIGSSRVRGTPKANGLVPKTGRLPPHGGISADELAKPRPTSPRRARWSTNQPTTPAE